MSKNRDFHCSVTKHDSPLVETEIVAYICSRYNDTDPDVRRRNLREHDALCRWAIRHGYAPVSPFAGVDRDDPPDDAAGGREAALARSQALAAMVGAAGGMIVVPEWYEWTPGMDVDYHAWFVAQIGIGGGVVRVPREEVIDETE